MGLARSTIRTPTENRLIELIAALDGFADKPSKTDWLVTAPFNGSPTSRRWLVIGTPDGAYELEGMEAGTTPGEDSWTITCGIACTDVANAQEGKQAVEDVLNAVADMLAADPRLGQANGLHDVHVSAISGPYSDQQSGKPRISWLNFDISCSATIRRNLP